MGVYTTLPRRHQGCECYVQRDIQLNTGIKITRSNSSCPKELCAWFSGVRPIFLFNISSHIDVEKITAWRTTEWKEKATHCLLVFVIDAYSHRPLQTDSVSPITARSCLFSQAWLSKLFVFLQGVCWMMQWFPARHLLPLGVCLDPKWMGSTTPPLRPVWPPAKQQ